MLQHPEDKVTLTQITDQGFRSLNAGRAVDQLIHILDVQGIPRFFSQMDRALLRGFQSFGNYLPGVAVPMVKDKMRKETANVILPAEPAMLRKHLLARREEGIRMNVNFLGEALIGEREAQRRLEKYLHALQQPEIEVVSVKISTLYSQISALAREHSLHLINDRLELLYRAAVRAPADLAKPASETADSTKLHGKFVYLDMEEYRDMSLTAAAFMATLDRKGLEHVRAGIALQAYVPDSFLVQQQITEWARQRTARGASPITIRIVKGANMEMERVEASLRGWPQAPYKTKLETDANYKQMLLYGMQSENIRSVKLGIASHNLFEVAFALVAAGHFQVMDHVQFEMLEGMANHQRRALRERCENLLLYAPACSEQDFTSAIGYLVRRLDENTGPDNFLRHAFKITAGSPTWNHLESQFVQATRLATDRAPSGSMGSTPIKLSNQPRRTQNRFLAPCMPLEPEHWTKFENEPDTDFSLEHNGRWAQTIIENWIDRADARATQVAITIAGRDEEGNGPLFESFDPSRPGVVVARYRQADENQLKQAIDVAVEDRDQWRQVDRLSRYQLMRQVAQRLRERRADLIGAALADGGKTIAESDPEVSEAIDFVEFYARVALDTAHPNSRPIGAVLVISPWNFPIAIPCGGIAAALAAGNNVLLKPASDTVLPARILCECFWEAGISKKTLQLLPCSGRLAGEVLLQDPRLNAVILTGGTETAQHMLSIRPDLHLLAETGGKNATIVSSLSDHDLAIKNVLHSAFSHSGQKCSATSLLLLEEELYRDSRFRETLVDAVTSLEVGSAWKLSTKIGPLIRPPADALLRGLKELEPGETWAVMPRTAEDNPCLVSPGIKWDVQPGSFTHKSELFGPVLGVMSYRHLDHAIGLVHQTGYGLTSGLESLDDREQSLWTSRMRAGNLYINRPTTGAIVLRQPFGGMGKSAFGPGIKAGGPNYVVPLLQHPTFDAPQSNADASGDDDVADRIQSRELKSLLLHLRKNTRANTDVHPQSHTNAHTHASSVDRQLLEELIHPFKWADFQSLVLDYDWFAREEILVRHDTVRLIGQDNIRRYLPLSHLRIRVSPSDHPLSVLAMLVAAASVGARATVSSHPGDPSKLLDLCERLTGDWGGGIEFLEQSDEQLVRDIERGQVDRLRYAARDAVPTIVRRAANAAFVYIADASPSPIGRVELLWYVQEQSLCFDYHRYGNLGIRSGEDRREPH